MTEITYNTCAVLSSHVVPFPASHGLSKWMETSIGASANPDNYHDMTESYFVMCAGQFYVAEMVKVEGQEKYELKDGSLVLATDWLKDEEYREIREMKLFDLKEKIRKELEGLSELEATLGEISYSYLAEQFVVFSEMFFKMKNV